MMKLFVAPTETQGWYFAKALELGDDWKVVAIGQGMGAPKVSKIVVLRGHLRDHPMTQRWIDECLMLRVRPETELVWLD